MRFILFTILLNIFPTQEKVEYEVVAEIKTTANFFTTDRMGNVYIVDDRKLTKYNSSGKQMGVFNKNVLGRITFVDASNPYRILVYYGDFLKLTILDNMLGEITEPFDLNLKGLDQVTLIAKSYNNGIWLFDPVAQQLMRMDEQLTQTLSSTSVNQIIDHTIDPVFMVESDRNLYMSDPATGIMVFDIFGNYIKTLPIIGVMEFQVVDEKVIYFDDGKLKSYNQKTLEHTVAVTTLEQVNNARIEQHLLYTLSDEKLRILRIK